MKVPFSALLVLLTALFLSACQEETPARSTSEVASARTWFPLTVGDQSIEAQFAVAQHEQQRGLMDRDSLGQERGMLFVFSEPQRMSFWMRRTRIPLDIGYFTTDGVLHEIYAMEPFDENAVPSVRTDLRYALEMNQGWFSEHDVKPGDKLDLAQVNAALKARGFEPQK